MQWKQVIYMVYSTHVFISGLSLNSAFNTLLLYDILSCLAEHILILKQLSS